MFGTFLLNEVENISKIKNGFKNYINICNFFANGATEPGATTKEKFFLICYKSSIQGSCFKYLHLLIYTTYRIFQTATLIE